MSESIEGILRRPARVRGFSTRIALDARGTGLERWQLASLALLGALAAAGVGYLTSRNPLAAPTGAAVALRVALIVTEVAAALYALSGRGLPRMGLVLLAAVIYSSVWLLNGSSERLAFSIGVLLSGLSPTAFSYLVLAYPRGRLRSDAQRWLLVGAGGVLFVLWTLAVLTHAQPPTKTPLVQCVPHCPRNTFFVTSIGPGLSSVLETGILLSWTAVACGTPLLLSRFVRSAPAPLRRSWIVVEAATWANAAAWIAFLLAHAAGSRLIDPLGGVYVGLALAIPLAILIRLAIDRTLMGRLLAQFVDQLAASPDADLQGLMGHFLDDPSLTIAYLQPEAASYVDVSGTVVAVPRNDPDRAVAWIDMTRGPVAAIVYDARLTDHAAFVHAAGAAASLRLEAARLETELGASTTQLEASRLRLLEAADAERQRIERDLHDGVQQQIVGLRLKLDLATEIMRTDGPEGERMLSSVGRDLDELLRALRSLAKGIYPSLLKERGLREALSSVALAAPVPVALACSHVSRLSEDAEVAVYFTCVEALQNVAKHAGPVERVTLRLWQSREWLRFEVQDNGQGFDPEVRTAGIGIINMHDRIEAVGGKLWVSSKPWGGTTVRARVPVGESRRPSQSPPA